ncbi:heavy metal-associated isoprenylated plant protein 41-like [Lycium barbarum]|uniref:heavy metal-associated isoprenylated plant protein 41-like n=1 Tax=Lycium barbarum TaxID=112863 RepID=UPI00293E9E09|nr:heavy metal-associated isoprenylated plant protein 41-like [Lycium barbarum]
MADKSHFENQKVINEEEEKRIEHYSSYHQILLVGEGDFSFSHSFGNASNIVASSLRSYDEVIKMYKNGQSNLEKLKSLGGSILHGVDATKMQRHCDLRTRNFDRIIYNFPHAGFYGSEDNNHLIQMHRNLVESFFGSAKRMLPVDGQIHVTHKTTPPYDLWDLVGLASKHSLFCIECAEFKIENYPGHNNKRGAGSKCDEPFHLGECSTFKFILSYIQETFGREDVDVEFSVRQAIQRGALMFIAETGRPSEDYLKVLDELHFWSRSRILGLKQKLQDLDQRVFEQQRMGYYL